MARFDTLLRTAPAILADGGLETRLIFEDHLDLPEFAAFLPLFRDGQRGALARIYGEYLDIAARHALPIQIGTPTWRAHRDCLARLGFSATGDVARVNGEAVRFLQGLRAERGLEDSAMIAGVIGPRGDGYDPTHAPDIATAEAYHAEQACLLAGLGVDLLYAPSFPAAAELEGAARAMAATGLPYVLAPVITPDGALLDGTPYADFIAHLDATLAPAPLHYMVGCTHPSRFADAERAAPALGALGGRLAGLKANASPLPPEALNDLDHLEESQPEAFAAAMMEVRRDYRLRILGGCCGTNGGHLEALAGALRAAIPR
ncbi:homocysteine S-methyltransferase family protein [Xanthobacter sp. DSM 24535]|uniref:homocysteine S-methyltransferase family protein n=1 Tax=Roseixanthobacter psychrophilus TaxID=3119917 RepID=UPI00372B0730